jgi:hypothetical protein
VVSISELWEKMRSIFFSGEYDAVIICLGARTAFLPELSGMLPLRTCRGVVAHLQLIDTIRYLVILNTLI